MAPSPSLTPPPARQPRVPRRSRRTCAVIPNCCERCEDVADWQLDMRRGPRRGATADARSCGCTRRRSARVSRRGHCSSSCGIDSRICRSPTPTSHRAPCASRRRSAKPVWSISPTICRGTRQSRARRRSTRWHRELSCSRSSTCGRSLLVRQPLAGCGWPWSAARSPPSRPAVHGWASHSSAARTRDSTPSGPSTRTTPPVFARSACGQMC